MDEFQIVVRRVGGVGYVRERAYTPADAINAFDRAVAALEARGFRGRVNKAGVARLGKWCGFTYVRVSVFVECETRQFSLN